MTDNERKDLEIKLRHLTIDGARDFWNEIEEWLDAIILKCEKKFDRAETLEEFKEAQIMKRVCEKLKHVPDNMALYLKQQLAETTPGDKKSVEDALNFVRAKPDVKQEAKDG